MIIGASFKTGDITLWENRALMYGDGVFETMRCQAGHVALWPWHLARLQQSLNYLKIDLPDIRAIETVFKNQQNQHQSILRLTVFRDQPQRGYQPRSRQCHWFISQHNLQSQPQPQILGIAKQRLSPQPLLKNLKHLNRLPQVVIAAELTGQSVDDLLVLNEQDEVIETTCQNILLISGHKIYTPALQDCGVNGVALTWLKQQLPIATKHLNLADAERADALMTANAVHGFRAVSAVKTLAKFQTNHPICDRISRLWQQLID